MPPYRGHWPFDCEIRQRSPVARLQCVPRFRAKNCVWSCSPHCHCCPGDRAVSPPGWFTRERCAPVEELSLSLSISRATVNLTETLWKFDLNHLIGLSSADRHWRGLPTVSLCHVLKRSPGRTVYSVQYWASPFSPFRRRKSNRSPCNRSQIKFRWTERTL